jgi:hypothetical protein
VALMTVLIDRPHLQMRHPVSRADNYERRKFIDGLAHLYRKRQLSNTWLYLLTPWCEEQQRFPLRHDRDSLSTTRVRPTADEICPACNHRERAAHMEARRAET